MTEYEEVVWLANETLDTPYSDPDSNQAMMSRQFLRMKERAEAAEAELAALRERQRWIPVEEKLPEIGKQVLVMHPSCAEPMAAQYIIWPKFPYAGVERLGFWSFNWGTSELVGVTHWKALSAAPER